MPQPRGDVPRRHAQRIVEAVVAFEAAKVERDAAIAAALKAGGSTREVGALTGLSQTRVAQIGHAHGWPTAQQQSERERHRAELAQWRQFIEDSIARVLDKADED